MSNRDREVCKLPTAHVPALDGIRGIAVLMVMMFHFSIVPKLEQISSPLDSVYSRVVMNGWAGVDLFFVLSGFLITGILLRTRCASNYFRAFYARRALRIFPLYYGFLAMMIFVVFPVASSFAGRVSALAPIVEQTGELRQHQTWFWLYISNIYTFLHDGTKAAGGMGHFWSLAIEEQYYLVWTPLVFLLSVRRLIWLCVVLIGAVTIYRAWAVWTGVPAYTVMTFTLTRVDTILYGSLTACLLHIGIPCAWGRVLRRSAPFLWLMVFLIPIWVGPNLESNAWLQIVLPTMLAIAFSVTVLGVGMLGSEYRSGLLTSRPLVRLGVISYGLYVFHVPVRGALLPVYERLVPQHLIAGSQLHWTLGFVLLAFLCSLIVAECSWRLFESQVLKLKKRFPYHFLEQDYDA